MNHCLNSPTQVRHLLRTAFFVLFLSVGTLLYSLELPDQRDPWTTSNFKGTPEPPPPFLVKRTFGDLTFKNPVEIVREPGTDRWWVVEVNGQFKWFSPNTLDVHLAGDVRKVHPKSRRAFGLAFHPNYPEDNRAFICYVGEPKLKKGSVLASVPVVDGELDFSNEIEILRWQSGGHNGGSVKFGPDGMCYVSAGDGASPSPPDHYDTGQMIGDIMASIIRLNVDEKAEGLNYSIPADNPFIKTAGARPEIWAFGFRNPWRMSFDRLNGDLWTGDVGWELWELVFRVVKGGNYGWSIFEGSQPVRPEFKQGPGPILKPVVQHSHIEGRSITGGFVYRGKKFPELYGKYVYGDYITGRVWALEGREPEKGEAQEIAQTSLQIICFGEGTDGELLVVDYAGGIYELEKQSSRSSLARFPSKLSESGLFSDVATLKPEKGVYPYEIIAEPWSDGLAASRHIAIPDRETLSLYTRNIQSKGQSRGAWNYPQGTVFVKTLWLPASMALDGKERRIETQVLHKLNDEWKAYAYVWNQDQTDASLAGSQGQDHELIIRDRRTASGQSSFKWRTTARSECLLCHTYRGGTVYGFNQRQLSKGVSISDKRSNLVKHFESMGMFADPVDLTKYEPIAAPYDESATLKDRAKSYLHLNCAHCHRKGGGGTAVIDLRLELPWDSMDLIDMEASQGAFGISDAKIVKPASPFSSTLLYRMAKTGSGRMPHFASSEVDEKGIVLIRDWIGSLKNEQTEPSTPKRKQKTLTLIEKAVTTETALELAVHCGSLKESQIKKIIPKLRELGANSNPSIRDLFERFIPADERRNMLGQHFDSETLLARKGDLKRGRSLFFSEGGARCASCHQVEGEGAEIGPDLSEIGNRYSKAEILKHIVEPSLLIEDQYVSWDFEMNDDFVYSGTKLSEDSTTVQLRDSTGKVISLNRKDILVGSRRSVSTMPTGLINAMTAEEAASLLDWLSSLKK